jgi:hypothetical protein
VKANPTPIISGRNRQRLGARLARWKASPSGALLRARFSVEPTGGRQFQTGTSMNRPTLQQEMSTYADVKARCAHIVTRFEAIATDPTPTPADPRDLFIRFELLSYELRGATFRIRECGGRRVTAEAGRDASVSPTMRMGDCTVQQKATRSSDSATLDDASERLRQRCASCRRE